MDHFLETGFVNRYFASLQRFDFPRVVIDADNVVAHVGEASAGDKTDVTGTNDGKIHASEARSELVAAEQAAGQRRKTQHSWHHPAHWPWAAPAGSKFKSRPNFGNALRVMVKSTPYSFTPALSRTTAPNEATQLVRSR